MKSALFIVSTQGLGHVVRSRAIAAELCERGWTCSTAGGKRPPGFKGDVVIVDGEEMPPDSYDWPCKVVAITDTHKRPPCQLWFLPSASRFVGIPRAIGDRRYAFLGPDFSPIRREFVAARERRPERAFGGIFDARNASGTWTAEQMASLISGVDVVITYAGMRAMEAACIGVPAVVLARNDGERLNADGLQFAGAATYAFEEEDEEAVQYLATNLARSDAGNLSRMSAAGRALVDGRGVQRIADAIEEEVGG